MTPANWPKTFAREDVRNWLEEASGVGLSVEDSLPDTLVATGQALGLLPVELKIWVYDFPKGGWTGDELSAWARRLGFNRVELAAIEREAAK